MKKTFKSLLSLFLAVFMVASLIVIPSSAASISKTSLTLTKGYQTTLSVSGASNVKWSTGNKSIATVSSKGKVVGKGIGSTYVYAKTSSKTFKCKVTVVAAKITASNSTVELDAKGDSQIVTMTVKGSHSGLTVGTTNRKVASASWVKPVEWDGNKVKLRITAKGEGSCRIKVYLKKYSKSCYKYIDVNVGDSMYEDPDDGNTDSDSDMVLVAYPQSVDVNAGTTASFQVYCSDLKNMSYSVSNSSIATVTAGTTNGNYKTYTVRGITSGTVTVRFYDKNDTKKYVDVTVKVGGNMAYYEFYTVSPTKLAATDNIVKIPVGNTTYYMLVPGNYDPAYVNTLVAQKFNKYSYYEVYNSVPARQSTGDTYYDFVHSNSAYNYGTRYILLPANYDKVKLNTAIAKYNNRYEYYTVYNVMPTVTGWDWYDSWTVYDISTGKNITRYMLLPYNYDREKADKIKAEDTNSYNAYQYYVAYDKMPNINYNTDQLFIYTKSGKTRYMVVPQTNMDIVRRNEEIRKDTGVYEAYVMYSTVPTANTNNGEKVLKIGYSTGTYFVLCRPNDPNHDTLWATVTTAAPRGT